MKVYEVLNYYDRSRYFISAKSEDDMLEAFDKEFLRQLVEVYEYDEEELLESKEARMEYLSYTLLIEDATQLSIEEHNLEGDLGKFYF